MDVSEDDFEVIKEYLSQEEGNKAENEDLVKPSNAADKTLSVLAVICLVLSFVGLIVGTIYLAFCSRMVLSSMWK